VRREDEAESEGWTEGEGEGRRGGFKGTFGRIVVQPNAVNESVSGAGGCIGAVGEVMRGDASSVAPLLGRKDYLFPS